MLKLALATFGLCLLHPVPGATPACVLPPLRSASVTVEYNATLDSAALIVEAESDAALGKVRLHAPDGTRLLELSTGPGQGVLLAGVRLESEELSLAAFVQTYPEGTYEVHAREANGQWSVANAPLSHRLARPAAMNFPREGFVGVPTTGLLLSWTGNPLAAGYELTLEQGENDGLRIRLPPGSTSFLVPDGFLAGATQTQLEVAAIAANGNRTITAIEFTTQ